MRMNNNEGGRPDAEDVPDGSGSTGASADNGDSGEDTASGGGADDE